MLKPILNDQCYNGRPLMLQYHVRMFDGFGKPYKRVGLKWEECRYIDGHFEPWLGDPKYRSTDGIAEEDITDYMLEY